MAETGFGTGLNFLTLWQAFDAFEQQHPDSTFKHLHYVSFEKYPLLADDLAAAHARWPELKHFSEQLCAVWPAALPGCHRVFLADGRITLDLWFGDVNELIHVLPHSLNEQIDAWFLDGFAPSKNPDMWTPELFDTMVKLAKKTAPLPPSPQQALCAAVYRRRALMCSALKALAKSVKC